MAQDSLYVIRLARLALIASLCVAVSVGCGSRSDGLARPNNSAGGGATPPSGHTSPVVPSRSVGGDADRVETPTTAAGTGTAAAAVNPTAGDTSGEVADAAAVRPAAGSYYYRAPAGTPIMESGGWHFVRHLDDADAASVDVGGYIRDFRFGDDVVWESGWHHNSEEPCEWSTPLPMPLTIGTHVEAQATCEWAGIVLSVTQSVDVLGRESVEIVKDGTRVEGTSIQLRRVEELLGPQGEKDRVVTDTEQVFAPEYGLTLRVHQRTQTFRDGETEPSVDETTTFTIERMAPHPTMQPPPS